MPPTSSDAKGPAYDAAVIGGGPAGLSAAITLAQAGARVVLLEAKTYPHDKLCGEFLSPECRLYLEALGAAAAVRALGPAVIERVQLSPPEGAGWGTALPGPAWSLSRRALDAGLAAEAARQGVELREGSRVTRVAGGLAEGFELETRSGPGRGRLRARTVIAAHGKRSGLDRALGRDFIRERHEFVAVQAHFHGPPLDGRVELHTFPGGYCGLADIEEGRQVACMLVRQPVLQAAARPGNHGAPGGPPIENFLGWLKARSPRLRDWFERAEPDGRGWISIAQVPFVRKRAAVDQVLMAGDAAGLIAPLAGDGIAMALAGGALAGRRVRDYLAGDLPGERLPGEYAHAWERRFAGRIRLSYRLQALLLHPQWARAAFGVLRAAPGLGRYLVLKTRGMDWTV